MMRNIVEELSFFKGKKVFVTGHTGFKGTWLCQILIDLGASVTGYALNPLTEVSLFELSGIEKEINHNIGDIRDIKNLNTVLQQCNPDIVIHLAAQPIVEIGYKKSRETYEINTMGTVNLLECVRKLDNVKSVLNVTTDKVYCNLGYDHIYREGDILDGLDPYSNSKSCSELITHCYNKAFLEQKRVAISTARSGNVIGGGDFTRGRIIPDCIYSALNERKLIIRNPYSIRPYQHVFESLFAYLLICFKQYENNKLSSGYNIGPQSCDCKSTKEIVTLFEKQWGKEIMCKDNTYNAFHEDKFIRLNCTQIHENLGWSPIWDIEIAIKKVVEWTHIWFNGGDIRECMKKQVKEYINTMIYKLDNYIDGSKEN